MICTFVRRAKMTGQRFWTSRVDRSKNFRPRPINISGWRIADRSRPLTVSRNTSSRLLMEKFSILGYSCLERRKADADGWYRLFVVVEPVARATLGARLVRKLSGRLLELGARHAWMMEYQADIGFVAFLEGFGFVKIKSLELDGHAVVQLAVDPPFQL
jgi:hypothetical protein